MNLKRFLFMVLFALQIVSIAAAEEDISVSTVGAPGTFHDLTREAVAEGPAGILAAVSGVESFPVPCATPILLHAAARHGRGAAAIDPLSQARALISIPPALPEERTMVSGDQRFVIHYSDDGRSSGLLAVDRNRDGHPDLVNHLAEALAASRSQLVTTLGYPDPVPEGGQLDLFLMRLGRDLEGIAVPGGASATGFAGRAFMLLDADLSADRIVQATVHQVAHLSLLALDPGAATWWAEATAAFLTLVVSGDSESPRDALAARLQSPSRGLTSDLMLHMRGGLLWPLFLVERTGDVAIIRQIWGDMAARGAGVLEATDAVLSSAAHLSLRDAFREYAAWNLFTGERDDGGHYSFGHALPEAYLELIGPGPSFHLGPVEPIAPLGSIAFRLPGEGSRGAIDLEFAAAGGRPEADLLVFDQATDGAPLLVPLKLDDRGVGRASIPWEGVREIWILLRNEVWEEEGAARFELRGDLDPLAPYDLAAFTSQPSGQNILLEWTTASEKGLIGWNVHRGRNPGGPFTRLNAVALPAYGEGAGETGYIFIDEEVRAGRRYYYVIEGLTTSGLAVRSHVTSARTPSR